MCVCVCVCVCVCERERERECVCMVVCESIVKSSIMFEHTHTRTHVHMPSCPAALTAICMLTPKRGSKVRMRFPVWQ